MPTKILVVDDETSLEPLMQQRFRRKIQAGEYAFRFATSGQEALIALRRDPEVDVVLLDINMPDLDGLTLLGQLPELVPTSRAVMVSAYGDLTNVRSAMNRGAFDFVMKPINFQDLELTIEKTARHVRQLRESIHTKAVAELKARFFDNITHEFRTPLSLIIAPVDAMLQHPHYDAATRQNLLTVRRNAYQLLHLINQLLDLAKMEADGLPVIESEGDVVAFLSQVTESFETLAGQKKIILVFTANVSRRQGLFDADKWHKILSNLLSNALKFTTPGGKVSVHCQSNSNEIQLTVADTGIGIEAQHLPRIFDRFYQVDSSPRRVYEGSGIGLALAYELTQRLGGELSVVSTTGVGTTFTARLPTCRTSRDGLPASNPPAQPAVKAWSAAQSPVETPAIDSPAAETTSPLVLLVEDNGELLAFMAQSLAGHFRVLTAGNGSEGLAMARQELPDVIVSDLMMPGLDGYQLTNLLKCDPATDHIAVVLLTARAATESRREGLAAGADDYLTKPFDLDELRLRLRNIVTRQQKLRDYYQRQLNAWAVTAPDLLPQPESKGTPQSTFLLKLHGIIEAHLDDSTFRAESLAGEVAMSVRTLTRKLSSLAGISPARLIRSYRLRRATELLQAGHPVAETAYLVGFEHPANFATAFKEVYQQSPTEFLSSNGYR